MDYVKFDKYSFIEGSIVTNRDTKDELEENKELDINEKIDTYLVLDGRPNNYISKANIGSVNIVIN